jgi:hypothetical protein
MIEMRFAIAADKTIAEILEAYPFVCDQYRDDLSLTQYSIPVSSARFYRKSVFNILVTAVEDNHFFPV